ncbi:MAG: hypothetical protein NVSMB38_42420 [Ktedonobacteraceae bacterium]
MGKPAVPSPLVRNEPVANALAPKRPDNGGWHSISKSMTSINREEPFWELPDNSIWVIGGYAILFDLPNFLNGANQHRPKVLLIPIGPICKNDGNKDVGKLVLYGKNCKPVASRATG